MSSLRASVRGAEQLLLLTLVYIFFYSDTTKTDIGKGEKQLPMILEFFIPEIERLE